MMKLRHFVFLLSAVMLFLIVVPSSFAQTLPRKDGPYENIGNDPCAGTTSPDECMAAGAVHLTCRGLLGVPSTYCFSDIFDKDGHYAGCNRAPVTSGGCICEKGHPKGSCTNF